MASSSSLRPSRICPGTPIIRPTRRSGRKPTSSRSYCRSSRATILVLADARGRLLLGFSKSGYGAFSLLLRHPDLFGRASAWDAPLNLGKPGAFGSGDIFGTPENFEKYHVSKLLEQRADLLAKEKRLGLIGYANFHADHQAIHDQMTRLKLAHEYRDEKKAKHTWDAGWIADSVRFLTATE